MSNSSGPMPVPSAAISVPISAEPSILSKRARSTFRILPRSGRIAWFLRLRPCLAEPPAESPSTMKISDCAGSRSWQSASLPGSEAKSSAPLRRVSSRALRAASRAAAAVYDLGDDLLGLGRMLLQPLVQLLGDHALDRRADLGGDELVLGLGGEFGIGHLDREHAGQALAHVVAGERHLVLLGAGAVVQHTG